MGRIGRSVWKEMGIHLSPVQQTLPHGVGRVYAYRLRVGQTRILDGSCRAASAPRLVSNLLVASFSPRRQLERWAGRRSAEARLQHRRCGSASAGSIFRCSETPGAMGHKRMRSTSHCLALLASFAVAILGSTLSAAAQEPSSILLQPFSRNARQIESALDYLGSPLSAEDHRRINEAIAGAGRCSRRTRD